MQMISEEIVLKYKMNGKTRTDDDSCCVYASCSVVFFPKKISLL